MHCKYCNENSIIFDLVEAMEFEYIVVGAYWVKEEIKGHKDSAALSFFQII